MATEKLTRAIEESLAFVRPKHRGFAGKYIVFCEKISIAKPYIQQRKNQIVSKPGWNPLGNSGKLEGLK